MNAFLEEDCGSGGETGAYLTSVLHPGRLSWAPPAFLRRAASGGTGHLGAWRENCFLSRRHRRTEGRSCANGNIRPAAVSGRHPISCSPDREAARGPRVAEMVPGSGSSCAAKRLRFRADRDHRAWRRCWTRCKRAPGRRAGLNDPRRAFDAWVGTNQSCRSGWLMERERAQTTRARKLQRGGWTSADGDLENCPEAGAVPRRHAPGTGCNRRPGLSPLRCRSWVTGAKLVQNVARLPRCRRGCRGGAPCHGSGPGGAALRSAPCTGRWRGTSGSHLLRCRTTLGGAPWRVRLGPRSRFTPRASDRRHQQGPTVLAVSTASRALGGLRSQATSALAPAGPPVATPVLACRPLLGRHGPLRHCRASSKYAEEGPLSFADFGLTTVQAIRGRQRLIFCLSRHLLRK